MRAGPPNQFSTVDPSTTSRSEVKSLFQNILRVSPSGSRFCGVPFPSLLCKPFRMNILGNRKKENSRHQRHNALRTVPKSLFQNILPASSCGSRFYGDEAPSLPLKPLRMNILEKPRERRDLSRSESQVQSHPSSETNEGRASASAQN